MGNGFSLEQVATQAQAMDVFQYLIPFALVFAIIKGILSATGIFDNDQVENLIGLVIGFFVAFSPYGTQFYTFMQESLGGLSVGLLGILGIMLIVGLVFGDSYAQGWGKYAFGLLVLLVAWGVFSGTVFSDIALGPLQGEGEGLGVPENVAGILVIVIILALVAWAMGIPIPGTGNGGGGGGGGGGP